MRQGWSTASRRFTVSIAPFLLLTGLVGCSSSEPGARLTLTCREQPQKLDQQFTAAYASPGPNGYDLVLVNENGPTAVRQVLHARVLWTPGYKMKIHGPSTTNASLRWFVWTEGADHPSLIEYGGTAMITLDVGEEITKVDIRNAQLAPVRKDASLNDPIGPARLEGKAVARNDTARVVDLIGEMRATVASARTSPTPEQASVGPLAP